MIAYLQYLKIPTIFIIITVSIITIVSLIQNVEKGEQEVSGILKKIKKRKNANNAISECPNLINELSKKQDKDHEDILEIKDAVKKLFENELKKEVSEMQHKINEFASICVTRKCTKDQYDNVFELYDEYVSALKENGMKNGKTDVAMKIIRKQYENELTSGGFLGNEFDDESVV